VGQKGQEKERGEVYFEMPNPQPESSGKRKIEKTRAHPTRHQKGGHQGLKEWKKARGKENGTI